MDLNFDGFIDFSEFVLTWAEQSYFAENNVSGAIATSVYTGLSWSTAKTALLDYDASGNVDSTENFVYLIATHVWNSMTSGTDVVTFSYPTGFDQNLFNYYDQNLDGNVLIDEYYIAAKDSLDFKAKLSQGEMDFNLTDLALTRIENEWMDLNADGKID
jgi:hypothetical protein